MKHSKWTTKSTGNVADELKEKGYIISADTIGRLLKQENYSLKANRKSKEVVHLLKEMNNLNI